MVVGTVGLLSPHHRGIASTGLHEHPGLLGQASAFCPLIIGESPQPPTTCRGRAAQPSVPSSSGNRLNGFDPGSLSTEARPSVPSSSGNRLNAHPSHRIPSPRWRPVRRRVPRRTFCPLIIGESPQPTPTASPTTPWTFCPLIIGESPQRSMTILRNLFVVLAFCPLIIGESPQPTRTGCTASCRWSVPLLSPHHRGIASTAPLGNPGVARLSRGGLKQLHKWTPERDLQVVNFV